MALLTKNEIDYIKALVSDNIDNLQYDLIPNVDDSEGELTEFKENLVLAKSICKKLHCRK